MLEVAKITANSPSYLIKEKIQEAVPEESDPPWLA